MCLCVAAGPPHLHALHRVLSERPVGGLFGPPAAGDSEQTSGRDAGGAGQPGARPRAGEQGEAPPGVRVSVSTADQHDDDQVT